MYDYNYIHKLEADSKWREAEKEWNKTEYGRTNHAPACKMIADAIERGDELRAKDKNTIYTVIETLSGHFTYRERLYDLQTGQRLIGRVYGIGEATEAVVALQENKNELERVITGIKMDFPSLN